MLRYDDRVVIITGAGNGLGRSHALAFGDRGARVVVNDIGVNEAQVGIIKSVAEGVAEEIRQAGGTAIANADPVQDGHRVVEQAMDAFGRVDVVVNNAGILRDAAFHKMADDQWHAIMDTHLLGTYCVTRAAWKHMRHAGYGRVVMTSSAAGLYGNFGQANYAAAKLGMIGLGKTLAIEGAARGILVNTIAPVAASQLTAGVIAPPVLERLQPEFVSPLVLRLCHESHTETGAIFEVGGGWISAVRWEQSAGVSLDAASLTPEAIVERWDEITAFQSPRHRVSVAETMAEVGDRIGLRFGFGVQ